MRAGGGAETRKTASSSPRPCVGRGGNAPPPGTKKRSRRRVPCNPPPDSRTHASTRWQSSSFTFVRPGQIRARKPHWRSRNRNAAPRAVVPRRAFFPCRFCDQIRSSGCDSPSSANAHTPRRHRQNINPSQIAASLSLSLTRRSTGSAGTVVRRGARSGRGRPRAAPPRE